MKQYIRIILVGFAFMAISCFWSMYDGVVPLILKNTFGMNEVLNGVVMAMDNILALFLLPIFGIWSDKTNTKLGKRTPYILVGTVLSVATMIFMPIADNNGNLTMFLIATGLVLLFMSFYRSPAVAYMPDITPRAMRSRGNAVIMLMGTIGAIFALAMVKVLVSDEEGIKPNYMALFVSIMIFMGISILIMTVFCRENAWAKEARRIDELHAQDDEDAGESNNKSKLSKDKLKSLIFILLSVSFWYMAYNAVNSAFSRYSVEVLNMAPNEYASYMMVATVSAVISYIPIGLIAGRIGRKKTILAGVVGLVITFFACFFFNEGCLLLKVVFAFIGISWGAINVNSFPMVVEIASDGDEGKYTGYYYTFSMAAQVLTPVLSGVFLEYVSYKTLFPYGVIFSVLAFITMTQVKHGDTVKEKKSLLEHLDVGD